MWKKWFHPTMPKLHPTYKSESLCKADSRNVCFAKSARTIFGFPFFNLRFKITKVKYVFVAIRKNVPDNWTKIWYTFGPVKYRPNKRSGKLRIKSQIVKVAIFLRKNIVYYSWWQLNTYFIHFNGETLNISIVNGDKTTFF